MQTRGPKIYQPFALAKVLALVIVSFFMMSSSLAVEHVILLHGMCRTSASMRALERELRKSGYTVANVDYPSRTANAERLSEDAIGNALANARGQGATTIHFVTHSLGGILVRSYLSRHAVQELGRVVMLAPPNQGSEVVDRLGSWRIFTFINGPAGSELGTGASSTPNRLGPANFSLGVIAGNRSINWINSLLIAGPDDGKVSTEKAKLAGMSDYVVIPTTHPFIMRNRAVIAQTLRFLREGKFSHEEKREVGKRSTFNS